MLNFDTNIAPYYLRAVSGGRHEIMRIGITITLTMILVGIYTPPKYVHSESIHAYWTIFAVYANGRLAMDRLDWLMALMNWLY